MLQIFLTEFEKASKRLLRQKFTKEGIDLWRLGQIYPSKVFLCQFCIAKGPL